MPFPPSRSCLNPSARPLPPSSQPATLHLPDLSAPGTSPWDTAGEGSGLCDSLEADPTWLTQATPPTLGLNPDHMCQVPFALEVTFSQNLGVRIWSSLGGCVCVSLSCLPHARRGTHQLRKSCQQSKTVSSCKALSLNRNGWLRITECQIFEHFSQKTKPKMETQ